MTTGSGVLESGTRNLDEVLTWLFEQGIRRAFVEGGPTLASAFVAAGLADEYLIYLAPKLLGGQGLAIGDIGVGSIAEAKELQVSSVERLGDDLLVVARPVTPVSPTGFREEGNDVHGNH